MLSSIFFAAILTHQLYCQLMLDQDELIMVFVLTRHGARAPFYKNMDSDLFPYRHQDLTNIGTNLRQKYIIDRRFNQYYNTSQVRVISTNRSRTVQSALSMLEGLYPDSLHLNSYEKTVDLSLQIAPGFDSDFSKRVFLQVGSKVLPDKQQPFLVQIMAEHEDIILKPHDKCPKIKKKTINQQFEAQLWKDGFYERFIKEFRHFLIQDKIIDDSYNGTQTNKINTTLVYMYCDTLISNIYQGMPSSVDIDQEFLLRIKHVSDSHHFLQLLPSALLFSNHLIREINNFLLARISGKTQYQIVYFSVHDDNINNLLASLNLKGFTTNFTEYQRNTDRYEGVGFASSVIFELWKKHGEFSLNILINGKRPRIEFCGRVRCELNEWQNWVQKNTLDYHDWINRCNK